MYASNGFAVANFQVRKKALWKTLFPWTRAWKNAQRVLKEGIVKDYNIAVVRGGSSTGSCLTLQPL